MDQAAVSRPPSSVPVAVTRLAVRVTPRASRNEIRIGQDGSVKVRLRAPPVDNKANAALVDFLAGTLGVPRRAVSLAAGATSRTKHVLVSGLAPDAVRRLLTFQAR